MEAKFKILCSKHEACPDVMDVLVDLGFYRLRELNNSHSYDISAKIEVENGKEAQEIIQDLFKECEEIQQIQVTTRP